MMPHNVENYQISLPSSSKILTSTMTTTNHKKQIFNPSLSIQRYMFVEAYLMDKYHLKSVTDLGCGQGRMLLWLKTVPHLEEINFIDFDEDSLLYDLHDRFSPGLTEILLGRSNSETDLTIKVFSADMKEPDERFMADCFTLIEVIEHLELSDVNKAAETVFGYYQPKVVIITTPNIEFNHLLRDEDENQDSFRHPDHKFEFTRSEFRQWSEEISKKFLYEVKFDGVGHLPNSEQYGPCTQIAIFTKIERDESFTKALRDCFQQTNEAKLLAKNIVRGRIGGLQQLDNFPLIDWDLENLQFDMRRSKLNDDTPEADMDTS